MVLFHSPTYISPVFSIILKIKPKLFIGTSLHHMAPASLQPPLTPCSPGPTLLQPRWPPSASHTLRSLLGHHLSPSSTALCLGWPGPWSLQGWLLLDTSLTLSQVLPDLSFQVVSQAPSHLQSLLSTSGVSLFPRLLGAVDELKPFWSPQSCSLLCSELSWHMAEGY